MENKQENGTKKAAPKRDGGYSSADFMDGLTWKYMKEKVFRCLDKVARQEFNCILGEGDVNADDLQEIETQADVIKKCLCAYVDGLAAHYQIYGARFFGDASAEKEFYSKFRCNSD